MYINMGMKILLTANKFGRKVNEIQHSLKTLVIIHF